MTISKRLILDLPPEQHTEIKRRATQQGKTIKQYVLERVFRQESPSDQPQNNPWVELAQWAHRENLLKGQSHLVTESRRSFREGLRFD